MSTIKPAEPSPVAVVDPLEACDDATERLDDMVTAYSNSMIAPVTDDGPPIPGLPDEPLASLETTFRLAARDIAPMSRSGVLISRHSRSWMTDQGSDPASLRSVRWLRSR
jgi:hypothetical protein